MAAEEELLHGISLMKEGKEEGFNILYSHTYNYVYSRARSVMKTESDAQDLTQETFIQAYKGIASLEDANNVYAWLGGIVFRQGAKLYNKTKKELLLNEDQDYIFDEVETKDVDALPEESAELKATSDVVMGMIDELPELQRSAIVSFYYDHMKIEEIANVFECSVNTIKSRLNYAKKFLKSKVEEHQKQYNYKLFSFSPAVLLLALRGLLTSEKYTMASESAEKTYHVACDTLGITASAITAGAVGVAASSATGAGATAAAGTVASTGATGAVAGTAATAGTAALEGAAIGATTTASAAGAATTVATAAKAGGLIGKFLAMSTAAKTGAIVLATIVIGGGVTTAVIVSNNTPEPSAIVQEVVTEEPEVTMTPEPTATVAPTATPEPTPTPEPTVTPTIDDSDVRNLNGMELVIGVSYYFTEPSTPEYQALQAYREELMEKHNFSVRLEPIYDYGSTAGLFQTATTFGDPSVHVYLIHTRDLHHNGHLFYDLSTLPELDFNEDKWNSVATSSMSYKGGIYGMSPLTTETPQISGILYNKRLFEEAGLDPDLPYQLQERGEWTWENFKELCAQLTRDTNEDGETDVYALASYGGEMLEQLLSSTGSQIVTIKNGLFVNNANSDSVQKATAFAKELSASGYELSQTADSSWNYYETAFADGQVAMQFTQDLRSQSSYSPYLRMTDELGFVCCPKMDDSADYQMVSAGYVAVIPAFFDEKAASDIAFAYNLWTNPLPEEDSSDFDWHSLYDEITLDEKILTDTLPYYYEKNQGEIPAHYLVSHDVEVPYYYQHPFTDAPITECLQELSELLDEDVAKSNAAKKPPVTANPNAEKICSARVNYDSTVTITGYGSAPNSDLIVPDEINGMPVSGIAGETFYNRSFTSVTLPKGLKTIGDWAFGSDNITEFVLPDGVTTLGSYCINGSNLKTIVIPASVTKIGKKAFSSNVELTLVVDKGSYAETYAIENGYNYIISSTSTPTDAPEPVYVPYSYEIHDGEVWITGLDEDVEYCTIPEQIEGYTVTTLAMPGFADHPNLRTVNLPDTITTMDYRPFYGCAKLESIVIPPQITELANESFYWCTSLSSVTLPEGLTALGTFSLARCSFTTISLPSSLTSIGLMAFGDNEKLTTIEIPNSVTYIGIAAFRHCYNLESVKLPAGITSIADETFLNCTSLKEIVIPQGVSEVGAKAFEGCRMLNSVTLPNSLRNIGDRAFYGTNITELVIPESVQSIGEEAFDGCESATFYVTAGSYAETYVIENGFTYIVQE